MGVVLNRIPLRGADYYAGKSSAHTYYMSSYGDERAGREKKTDLKQLGKILWPYASKATDFIKHLFKAVFKLSPK